MRGLGSKPAKPLTMAVAMLPPPMKEIEVSVMSVVSKYQAGEMRVHLTPTRVCAIHGFTASRQRR